MTAVAPRHWRKAVVVSWVGAVLLFVALPADAGWLERARGVPLSATGIAISSYVVHEASVIQSLKQNAGELVDLFADMLDAVEEGDTKTVEEIWSDVEKVPGDIVREAFPVFRAMDAAAALVSGVRERLESAKRHIERFVGKTDGTDPRGALAISEDERHFYASTGILGDEPLPAVHFSTAASAVSEQPRTESWEDGHREGGRKHEHVEPSSAAGSVAEFSETRDHYESSLKSLEKLWVASRGDRAEQAELEGEDYQEALDALDRRRSELEAERRRQESKDYAEDQGGDMSSEDMNIVPAHATEDSGGSKLTARTLPDEGTRPPGDASHCVKKGELFNAGTVQQFDNVCDHSVRFYWCVAPDGCGSRRSYHPYFTGSAYLEAGSYIRLNVTRHGVEFHVAACNLEYDGDGTLREPTPVMLDANGKYRCESQDERQGGFLLTCDTLKRGMSVCVEYEYEKASEYRTARDQCSSSGYEARLDASCPKGQGASVCLHTTDDSEAVTYDYDPQRPKDEFIANCKRTKGRYLGSR